MNNILNLYNVELKRIYKWLLALLGILLAGNILIVGATIVSTINQIAASIETKPSISLIKSQQAKKILSEYNIHNMTHLTNLLLGLCVLICLAYALVIWYRDVFGKSKTVYALFMLPQNKINVYIAKAITVISMIYITMLTQILLSILSLSLIKSLVGFSNLEMYYILNPRIRQSLLFIQLYFVDFVMINVIGVILAVVVIFTGVMIQKSFKISGIVLGSMYVIGSIFIFFYLTQVAEYTEQLLLYHGIYYVVLLLVSIGLSYTLLNKKVYI